MSTIRPEPTFKDARFCDSISGIAEGDGAEVGTAASAVSELRFSTVFREFTITGRSTIATAYQPERHAARRFGSVPGPRAARPPRRSSALIHRRSTSMSGATSPARLLGGGSAWATAGHLRSLGEPILNPVPKAAWVFLVTTVCGEGLTCQFGCRSFLLDEGRHPRLL
jgi:hypothetical protein